MSLIVAQSNGLDIYIVGDTRLVSFDGQPNGNLKGSMKVVIISEKLCFAFAGDLCEKFTRSMPTLCAELKTASFNTTLDILLNIHIEYEQALDFIVCTTGCRSEIVKIHSGQISRNLPSAWIGDNQAFNIYQANKSNEKNEGHAPSDLRPKLFIQQLPDHDESAGGIVSSMCHAIQAVIANDSITTVGDFYTVVSSGSNGFYYLTYVYIDAPQQPPHTGMRTIEFGCAAEGGCSLAALAPTSSGVGAMGYHYFQANLGIVFIPSISFEPIVFSNCNWFDFVKAVVEKYDVSLDGPRFS